MRKFLSLLQNTVRDIIRQPVIIALTVACIVTNGLLPVVAVFSLGQEERIVRDGAVASCFVFGLFLAVASSVASISKQIRSGTAGMVLSKPVSRELFFGATYGGIIIVSGLFVVIATVSAMLSVRMALEGIQTDWLIGIILAAAVLLAFAGAGVANYRGRNFCSALFKALLLCLLPALFIAAFIDPAGGLERLGAHGHECVYCQGHVIRAAGLGHFGEFIQWRLVPVGLLVFMALSMLAAIAVALSTRFAPVVVFFCCCLVFVLGLISDYLFFTVAGGGLWAEICAAILPDWQGLLIYDALAGEGAMPWTHVCEASGYAVLYIGGVLCLGIMSFREADA